MHYAWLVWSLLLVAIWTVIYFVLDTKDKKREMLIVSLWTALTGLTEPLFVPAYWSPPSLFDLALKTGFDIESLVFSFGIGGIAVAIYERIFRVKHTVLPSSTRHTSRHRYHLASILSMPIIFGLLLFFTNWNPIYDAIVAMTAGGFATWYCRPDLKKKMLASAGIFLVLYFFYFLVLTTLYPGYVELVWNLGALSGILVAGVPLEELLFALSFGFLWSSIYEHTRWRAVTQEMHTIKN